MATILDRAVVDHVGREREPVVRLDDATDALATIRQDAIGRSFAPVGPYYPGVRAAAPPEIADSLIDTMRDLLRAQFGIGRLQTLQSYYSLVTTPPGSLALPQRFPHYDGVENERIALLLYLADDAFGGTAFYRHRATGFETIRRERLDPYLRTLGGELAARGVPAPAYIGGDTPLYERIHAVAARANRLIVYRGNLLHSADVPDPAMLSADPARGRLTLNIFLMGQLPTR